MVDLDGDGQREILVNEAGPESVRITGGGADGSSTWTLLDGEGHVLWRDERRSYHVEPGTGRTDDTANARILNLTGTRARALQLRTSATEWYVLPATSTLPDALPPCLE